MCSLAIQEMSNHLSRICVTHPSGIFGHFWPW